ncbi:MAG: protein kinase domain-containing protein [Gemmatimonadaceae bacterium]
MTEAPARLSGALSDRYQIDREIGVGGMATVYLAEDVRHHRKVAIKVLHPELSAMLGPDRFLKEIELTANLQHPHILPLFDSGNADGHLYYVMPYVEGETLRRKLEREQQLPIADALRISTEVADALEYAHKRGVVHRDIKPENILLHDGRPLVADFGIALAVQQAGGARMTQTGMSLGTPQYMAPEQAMGDKAVDHRADIYALGAITYEMLTGEPPFSGPNAQAIVAKVLTTDPTSLVLKRRSIPPHVEDAVLTALEKMPADRFSSAEEFSQALRSAERTATSRTVRSRGAGARPIRDWRSRARDPVFVALGVITLAAVAFEAVRGNAPQSAQAGTTVRFPLTLSEGMATTTSTQTVYALSPDGRVLAFVARERNGAERVFTRTIDDPTVRPLAGTEDAFMVFFSPDGQWLGFVANARLRKVRTVGGTVMAVADAPGIIGGGTWSPGGEIVASLGNGFLHAIPENGGAARRVCRSGTGMRAAYEGSPLALADGKTVVYASWATSNAGSGRIAVASLETGECTVLDVPGMQPLGVMDGSLIYVTDAGAIMAIPIDLRRRQATGAPEPLLGDVEINQTSGTAQAALSASGSLVYQSGSPANQAVIADLRGNLRPLTDLPRRHAYPRYSPDGSKVAVSVTSAGQRDVWVMDIASGTLTRLTTDGALNERPEWTPDGSRVLYRTSRERRSALWWRAADLSGPEEPLLTSPTEDYYEGVITPDGQAIVYQLDTAGAAVMYRMLAGDTTPKQLSSPSFAASMPRVSPDGRWLAYVATESGGDQVVVQPFPGPGARVQVSVSGGSEPVWSRDGRRLFYRDNQNVHAANVSLTGSFSILSREVLFRDDFVKAPLPHANYDVTPDGSHLLLLKATEQAQVLVVHNWREELRAQLTRPQR